ncbi:transcriptional repressor CTCF-like [Pectinophora gossypiella]|uniref:transcriptional repressor CTCF-like n=1 Tax=Pectinophora gossypiella TaxID=13191 RepID=UPI00214E1BAE|nr:transcriptional repressor CTCF-like [Pectinophora gossypiella]
MENDLEEVEIKIEYNESFETDPLSEDSRRKEVITSDLDDSCLPDAFNSPEVYNPVIDNVHCDTLHNDYLKDIIAGENTDGMHQEHETTWYKCVDSSGRFLCRFCDLSYSTVQTVRHHIKTKHPKNATYLKNIIINNKRNKKLKCHICNTRFKVINELQMHVTQKHNLESIQTSCNHCDATFNNGKEMLDHLYLKHQKLKNKFFSCTICGYRTSKKSHFHQHENTHVKIKSYKCQYCDYETNYLPNLTIHTRIHTNDKPYFCDYDGCNYRCAAKSALRSHRLKHFQEENMLYCDKCSYKTVYKQSLKKHIDSHLRNSMTTKLMLDGN